MLANIWVKVTLGDVYFPKLKAICPNFPEISEYDAMSEWQSYSPDPRHRLEMANILMERVKPEIKISFIFLYLLWLKYKSLYVTQKKMRV